MRVYASIARDDDLGYHEVGMTYCTVFIRCSNRTARARARVWANGRAYRLQFVPDERPYGPPTRTEYYKAAQP